MQASRTGTSNKLYRNNQICYPGTSTDNTGQVHQMYYTETSTTKYVIQGQVASEGKWTSLKRKYQAYIVCGFIWHKLWPHSQKCRLCDRFQVLSSPITLTTIDWSASGWKMILLHWWVGGGWDKNLCEWPFQRVYVDIAQINMYFLNVGLPWARSILNCFCSIALRCIAVFGAVVANATWNTCNNAPTSKCYLDYLE